MSKANNIILASFNFCRRTKVLISLKIQTTVRKGNTKLLWTKSLLVSLFWLQIDK